MISVMPVFCQKRADALAPARLMRLWYHGQKAFLPHDFSHRFKDIAHIDTVCTESERDGLTVMRELVGFAKAALMKQISKCKCRSRALGDEHDLLYTAGF